MSSPIGTSSGTFPRIRFPSQPARASRKGAEKIRRGHGEQPRLSGQVQFLAVPNGSPKDTGLKDALVGDQAGRSSNHASFGRQSEGPGDGSRYQNFLDGILLSGRNVHQITYNFQRPRFALEIVGTS